MEDTIETVSATAEKPDFLEAGAFKWAIVEIMGHRRHAGRCCEVERFGAKMLRVDIPIDGDPVANGWESAFYSGSSLFSYRLADEETVMRANGKRSEPARVTYRPDPDELDDEDGDDIFGN